MRLLQTAVLKALGDLSGQSTRIAIDSDSVVQWVKHNGHPHVDTADVVSSHTNLKRTGLTVGAGRGKWALTAKGLARLSLIGESKEVKTVTDPYLIQVLSDNTPCFGHHIDCVTCEACPIWQPCRVNKAHRLQGHKGSEVTPEPTLDPAETTIIDFTKAMSITMSADCNCYTCGDIIRKGEIGKWLREINGDRRGGMFHVGCAGNK